MAQTVILGSGIVGVSIAFYLSDHQPGSSIHLVEPSPELFASASGFAGGFLAKDWFGPDVAALGELSFAEHARLAQKHGGKEKWGYLTSLSYSHASAPPGPKAKRGDDWLRTGTSRSEAASREGHFSSEAPSWLQRAEGDHLEPIGDAGSTAQVDPRRLCQFLLSQCLARGVRLHHPAAALSVSADVRGELASVRIGHTHDLTETDVPCTRLAVAAGAWSPRAFAGLFPGAPLRLPVASLAGHSLVVRSPAPDGGTSHAVFSTRGAGFSPELFSRAGGEVYVAGLNAADTPLLDLPTDAAVEPAAAEALRATARAMVRPGAGGVAPEVLREGLCFRPVTPWGRPVLARMRDEDLGPGMTTRAEPEGGVFVAAGHGPWGISMSLGTGIVMAEMMQGREMSVDISGLGLRAQ